MAGMEDWELSNINGFTFYGHKPCGLLVMVSKTSVHEPLCPALTATPEEPEEA